MPVGIGRGLAIRMLSVRSQIRDGTRNRLGVLVNVEALVDRRGNWLNLGAQVALYVVEVEAVIPVD